MRLNTIQIALAAIALCGALPAAAQSTMTIQAEGMTRTNYALDGTLIKASSYSAPGTATQTFNGPSGTYNIQVFVQLENDGQPTLELYRGSTLLRRYVYPLGTALASFTVSNVALSNGQQLRLVGRIQGGAHARVDRMVLTQVAAATPTPTTTTPTTTTPTTTTPTTTTTTPATTTTTSASAVTMQAEGMTRSNYALDGSLIKASSYSSPGTATQAFSGATGTYNMQVYVQLESDGTPTLEVYKGSTLLRRYVYPLGTALTSFTISNVALTAGQQVRLVGRIQGGAHARVDRIVFEPVAVSTASTSTSTTPTTTTSTTPTTSTSTTPTASTSATVQATVPATVPTNCANPSNGYEGFGRNTTGGAGQPVYRVTNLNDSGAGSLRDAVSQANRCVVFDVGGTINMGGHIIVRGDTTIDGFTAPAPGITLRGNTLIMQGSSGSRNIVVRGIRHRQSIDDAIRVYQASDIVIDHVSVSGFGDGAIDITEGSSNITVQWSLMGRGNLAHNFPTLISTSSRNITVHHNGWFGTEYRQPRVAGGAFADVRNNLMWEFDYRGTDVDGASANVVGNYYKGNGSTSALETISVNNAQAYTSGNYSAQGYNVNGNGNVSTPFSAPALQTTDAITAAGHVLGHAGARGPRFGLDATDLGYIGQVPIAASTPTSSPTASTTGSTTTTASDGGVCSTAQCVLTQ